MICSLNLKDESELGLLMKAWKGTLGRDRPEHVAFADVERAVEKIVSRGGEFRCIRNPNRSSQIFGYSVVEDDVAHFAYVKRWFRGQGFASELLSGCKYCTYWNPAGARLVEKLQMRRIDL